VFGHSRPTKKFKGLASARPFSLAVFVRERADEHRAGSNKEQMNLRIDRDVIDAYKAQGEGWQTRMNDALRDWAKSHGMMR
jgi:uncharacterized protein (DUF4415 family)